MIYILDYGVGNIGSLRDCLDEIEEEHKVLTRQESLQRSDRLILPGVGAYGAAMQNLRDKNLFGFVNSVMHSRIPVLGVCLGMQLLFEESTEFGRHKGFAVMSGTVSKFDNKLNLKIPRIGWAQITKLQNHPILAGISENDYFYFLHSYSCPLNSSTVASTDYGGEYAAVVGARNVIGVQFHPEKSGKPGLQILRNFANYTYD